MDFTISFKNVLKMVLKLVYHKYLQFRLNTGETLVIETKYGNVKGVKRMTVYDKTYYAFEGIPYAKPPLGELRFKAPKSPESWSDVRDCTYVRGKPLQTNFILKHKEGTEDCLYLNVYTKTFQTNKPLPVIVWICGGAFQIGEATRDLYSPDYFMEKNVVLITVSYRIGALGFLSLSDPKLNVPGNAGLKDQIKALEWIKMNIANFNGDPNNVTMSGLSAGSASVHYLMLSEKAKGLFHKAILLSGSVLCPFASSTVNDLEYRLAKYNGYKGDNIDKDVFNFLSNISPRQLLVEDKFLLTNAVFRNLETTTFSPVVEPYISDDCLISEPPLKLLKKCWGNNIPLVISGTSFEGLLFYSIILKSPHLLNELNDCYHVVPPELQKSRDMADCQRIAQTIKETHFGDKTPSMDHLFLYLDLISYKFFWHGFYRNLMARANYSRASTYLLRFNFDSPNFNHLRSILCGSHVRGVSHGDDLSYLFYTIASWILPKDSLEYKTIERMIDIVVTFAEKSDPNCEQTKSVSWKPIKAIKPGECFKCLNLNETIEVIDLPETVKLRVWDSFYERKELY